jgi:hypothetical protein
MFDAPKKPVLTLALVALLAPASFADGFGVAFTRLFHHGAVSVGYSTGPFWNPSCVEPCPPRRWVPGHYETICRPVYVAGCEERTWVPARYGWVRDRYGRTFWACVQPGHFEVIRRPGRYENREVRVWVEGGWRS